MKPDYELFSNKDGKLLIHSRSLHSFPTPCLLTSNVLLQKKFHEIHSSFSSIIHTQIVHPLSANSDKETLGLIKESGAFFHAKTMEHLLVLKGILSDIGGVLYSGSDVLSALEAGARTFIVSSKENCERLQAQSQEKGVLLTLYLHLDTNIPVENPLFPEVSSALSISELMQLLTTLSKSERIPTIGIWSHLGHQNTDLDSCKFFLEVLKDLLIEIKQENLRLDVLNIGGGFPIEYNAPELALKQILFALRPDLVIIKKLFPNLTLEIEPGRFIAGQSTLLLAKILSIEVREERSILTLDCQSTFPLMLPALCGTKTDKLAAVHYAIKGFVGDYYLPQLEIGDLLCFFNAGAYTDFAQIQRILVSE